MAVNENNLIVKNSILLFVRMLFTMWLNLYATRIVLEQLGTSDYGVYGLVASVVAMFTMLNSGIVKTVQRFITIEIAKSDGNANKMFCTLLNSTLLFAIILFIILEFLGQWFLDNKMNIPTESRDAAFWVYQFSIITALMTLISNPYNALIIAHERMNVFAYMSILQIILNFLSASSLILIASNKLFWYGFLIMSVSVLIRISYQIYCRLSFPESKYHFFIEMGQIIEVTRFAGWSVVDGGLTTLTWNGIVWIINIFFGTSINAVYSIAMQVKYAVLGFAQNIQKAIDPQITKTYANGNFERHQKLIYMGGKMEVLLIFVIVIPLFANTDIILRLWLNYVPEYLVSYTRLTIFMSTFLAGFEVSRTAVTAAGNIRNYVLMPNLLFVIQLPVAYFMATITDSPFYVMLVITIIDVLVYLFRLYLGAKVSKYTFAKFVYRVYMPCVTIGLICYFVVYYSTIYIQNPFVSITMSIILSCAIIPPAAYSICSNEERQLINKMARSIKNRIKL